MESRGCCGSGLCYMQQTTIETVALQQPMKQNLDLGGLPGNALGEPLPADEVFVPNAFAIDGNTIGFGIRLLPDYYLYKSKIAVRSLNDKVKAGQLELPKGKRKTDEWFGEQEVYFDEVFGEVAIARATPEAMELEI